MSPTRFLNGDHIQQTKSGVAINGPRPTPLKLKQESHTIHKHQQQQPQMIGKPIIIYMRSPKVIHTKPHDFMALVQKLTGKSGSKHQEQQKKNKTLEEGYGVSHEMNNIINNSMSPMFNKPLNPFASDMPLFTPNSSDYLFSPSSFLKLSDVVSSSPNKTTNSSSPGSIVEFMKRLPEY
ncbi:putative VQ motif-containing protein/18/20/21/25 [Helianthus annuus]|nr:putative VQ motif-containing protein/18/20/21/25 [Helianthus annuus]